MATDIKKIVDNLLTFYDFSGRTVVSVGAGGGQLIAYGRPARKVLAVDRNPQAMEKLKASLGPSGLEDKFVLILSDFFKVDVSGDVVLFEFCLHEMPGPAAALKHARALAPEILVMDHWPGSPWAYIAAEEDKVKASWAALETYPKRKILSCQAVQVFKSYDELHEKVKGQGGVALSRIQKFKSSGDISIPMPYGFALI